IGKDDAIWQVGELELAQPGEVALRPGAHTYRRGAALAQQEFAQTVLGAQLVGFGIGSSADETAQRLVGVVWNPDWGEITTAQEAREFEGIAAIGLDFIAAAFGDQRWCDDAAGDAEFGQLAVQRVAGGSGLIRHVQLDTWAAESCNER